eukprot:PhM_4_TR15080/c0_g1_i1/m.6596
MMRRTAFYYTRSSSSSSRLLRAGGATSQQQRPPRRSKLMTLLGASAFVAIATGTLGILSWPVMDILILPMSLDRVLRRHADYLRAGRWIRSSADDTTVDAETRAALADRIKDPQSGLVLYTGPVRSGRTNTLLAAFRDESGVDPEYALYIDCQGLHDPLVMCFGVLTQLFVPTPIIGSVIMSYTKFFYEAVDVMTAMQGKDHVPYVTLSHFLDVACNRLRAHHRKNSNGKADGRTKPVIVFDHIDAFMYAEDGSTAHHVARMIVNASLHLSQTGVATCVLVAQDDTVLSKLDASNPSAVETRGNKFFGTTNFVSVRARDHVFTKHPNRDKELSLLSLPTVVPPAVAIRALQLCLQHGDANNFVTPSQLSASTGHYVSDVSRFLEAMADTGAWQRVVADDSGEVGYMPLFSRFTGTVPLQLVHRVHRQHEEEVLRVPARCFEGGGNNVAAFVDCVADAVEVTGRFGNGCEKQLLVASRRHKITFGSHSNDNNNSNANNNSTTNNVTTALFWRSVRTPLDVMSLLPFAEVKITHRGGEGDKSVGAE